MAKRIFRNLVAAAVLAVLLTALLIVPALYGAHEESMNRELWREAESVVYALDRTGEGAAYLQKLPTERRLTLISPDGAVLFDSLANAEQMENHLERPEVIQALENGKGESVRASSTLSEVTLYRALRTEDGSVLRVADTRRSMLWTLVRLTPLLVGMLLGAALTSVLLARRAARKIVEPINGLDLERPLENDAYDELAPLLTRMHRQHQQLDRQMRALENARAESTAIMANMREGLILLDKNSTILSLNESAARIFDVSAADAAGQPLLSVNRDANLNDLARRALCGESGRLSMERGGRRYDIFLSPVLQEESVRGAALLLVDVTERFEAEKSRRELTANVSHELKTPLTTISGFAEIIRDGVAKPQDVQRFAGIICRESARLIALVEDILELSRLDERQAPAVWTPVALGPLLKELTEDFSAAAEKKRQTLLLTCDGATVNGDPVQLREMFFNLIDNALKYTPEGGRISVSAKEEGETVVCAVADDGVGIPPEHQSRVFERFYRVDKSHSRQTGGTGLGLAIVKHIAQIHQAELRLQSAVQEGTEIRAIFPAANAGRPTA